MKRSVSFLVMLLCILAPVLPAGAQLRIVTYNTANGTFPSGNDYLPRTGMDNVLQAIGDEVTNGISKPVDVFIFQEHDEPYTTTQAFVDLLDGLYGAGTYGRSTVITGPTYTDNIRQTLVYNTNTVSLIGETVFGATGSSYAARQTARFQLRPVGYDSTADFYVYNSHYKASTGSTNEARRDYEANFIRTDADALGQGAHAIYAGDFNMYSSNEPAYQTLLSNGNGQAFDPINTPGNWNNNYTYRAVHTQSPHDGSDGLVTGGMDDRFDFQLVTGEMLDNEGMSYIPDSYHTFGNNGTTYNQAVNAAGNTYPLSQSLLDDLAHVSDHLPVVADYQLPAKMGVQVGSLPSTVIVGASVDIDITVTNVAPVTFANGADELDYNVFGTGVVTGSDSGIADPLAAGNDHTLSLDTATAGYFVGTAQTQATSQGAADAAFSENIAALIFDHAEASFSDSSDLDSLTIDFGSVPVGGVIETAFDLFNLEQTENFTADLDLDSISGLGDTDVLTTNLAAFNGLAAGQSDSFIASFDTSTLGDFSVTYTLMLSDEDLPGAQDQNLVLNLLGEVVADALPGDLDGDGYVGLDDLDIILNNWNQNLPPADNRADPSGDHYVGLDDLDIVLNHWNEGIPPTPGVTLSGTTLSGTTLPGATLPGASLPGASLPGASLPGAIPEPTAAALLLLGGFALANRRVSSVQ